MKELYQTQKQYSPELAIMQKILMDLLTKSARSPYPNSAFAKSKAECGNSNTLLANSSTPLTRAFFVRSSRTPKERLKMACSAMVACSGQGFALDCFPIVAVFHPVTRYRPTLWKMLAIAPKNQLLELSAMINPTQIIGKKRLNSFLFNNNQGVCLPLFPNGKQSTPISAKISENQDLRLTTLNRSPYSNSAFAKSKASREKLNQSYKANTSTPSNRAFFVRSIRTPQKSDLYRLFSMVERNRHAYAWLLSLYEQFSHPVTLYRPNREKFSGSSSKFIQGLHKMNAFAYSFLCAIRTPETDTYQETIVRIIADSEVNARLQLSADYRLVLPRPVAKIRQKSTACTVQGGIYA